MRSVIHFYVPSFYALLVQLQDPELSGKPVIAVHRSGSGEFVISASPEAKAQGVREGMTSRHAGRYCPDGTLLPVDWKVYKEASTRVLDILSDYSPLIEPQGLDRAYLDVTGCVSLFGTPASMAKDIQRRVKESIGIPMSAGIALNKLVSHAAASMCGSGKCLEIRAGGERKFLSPLPVRHLPGVGYKTEKRFATLGISTIGELASIPESMLARQFGVLGSKLHRLSHGIDYSPVLALYPPEIVVIEHMFPIGGGEPCGLEIVEAYLFKMCDCISAKLRERNRMAGEISLRLEFEDDEVITRTYVHKSPMSSTHEIYTAARRILGFEMREKEIASMRITMSSLTLIGGTQLSILEDNERRSRLQALLMNIHNRFGPRSLMYGSALSGLRFQV